MAGKDIPAVEPEVVLEYLKRTLPFSEIGTASLMEAARSCTIDFHPKATRIFSRGSSVLENLYLVQKGGVKLSLTDEEGREKLLDYRGEGGAIGSLALFGDGVPTLDAETVEDTFFILMPKEAFLKLVKDQPVVSQFFLKSFSTDIASKAFAELRHRDACMEGGTGLYLFASRVGDIMHGPPVTTAMGRSIQEAASLMVKQAVGSLLIVDPSGEVVGIITDKDLRKAVSVGMDLYAPIEVIMSTPVETVEETANCFDALLKMMSRQIHHLVVKDKGRVTGVCTSHDVMVLQGKSPVSLFREILAQRTIHGLYPLSRRIPDVVRTLVEEGAKADNITRMITVINDMILERLLTLLLKELGRPPAPFCWMLMGSEGRKEQTFHTDQDNALVYKDMGDEILNRASKIYFQGFAELAIEHLINCGYPPCPGEVMARNPKWCQPYTVWRDYFEQWIMVPEPKEVMNAAIFFDFRAGFGDHGFTDALRDHLASHCPRQELFLRHLAANCLETRPPISFFRSFIVEKNGEHKDTFDVKKRGLVPIVDFARVLSLQNGLSETNTQDRLKRLHQEGILSDDLFSDMRESYEIIMQIRLVHQLERIEQGYLPDNHVAPNTLSDLEKKTLKEAFSVIGRMQAYLKDSFRLNIA